MSSRRFLIVFLALILTLARFPETEASPTPMKFMCDMCESNWLHCLIKCNMEEYITRHNYQNHVYMGDSSVKPQKNQLDRMFEKIMHSTGHDHMKK